LRNDNRASAAWVDAGVESQEHAGAACEGRYERGGAASRSRIAFAKTMKRCAAL